MLIALCGLFNPMVTIWRVFNAVDILSTSHIVLAHALALPTPSLPNNTPSDPAALLEGTNPTAAKPTPSLPNATHSDPAPLPESTYCADDATGTTRPSVWISCKWKTVPPGYPPIVDGQLFNDQEFCGKLQEDLKRNIFGMCTKNPTEAGKPRTNTKVELIFKCVSCN